MFSVLRKISAFAGSRRGLLKKSMLVAFLGAVFTAFQFWEMCIRDRYLPCLATDWAASDDGLTYTCLLYTSRCV